MIERTGLIDWLVYKYKNNLFYGFDVDANYSGYIDSRDRLLSIL